MSSPGCNLASYTDFRRQLSSAGGDVEGPAMVEEGLVAADGTANRLFVFTGSAKVNVWPVHDNVMVRGVIEVVLDLTLSDIVRLVDSAAYAGLAAYDNTDSTNNTTFAVDCVDVITEQIVTPLGRTVERPVLRAALAVLGAGGSTKIINLAYQANLQVLIGFDLVLSLSHPRLGPHFGRTATIQAGSPWLLAIVLRQPAPPGGVTVTIQSLDPMHAPVPTAVTIAQGQLSATLQAAATPTFSTPQEVDVPVVATLSGFTSTAILKITAKA